MSERDDRATGDADEREQVYATTRHGRLSLDEIGGLMPGLGTLMPVIGDRYGWMVHAGRAGNWKLALYQLRKVRHLFRVGSTTRPKWREVIDAYDESFLQPIGDAIGASDPEAFEHAAAAAIDEANRIHERYNYGYIVYRVPEQGPPHMDVRPRDEP